MTDDVIVERHISAAPGRVWAMISDITRMGEWSPEATGGKWSKGASGPAVGAKFTGTNRNGWHRWSSTCTVSAAEPGRKFAFAVDIGPVAISSWTFDIEPEGDGCSITETWTDRRGRFARMLGKPGSGVSDRAAHNRVGMEQTLDRLAAAAEAGPSPRPADE